MRYITIIILHHAKFFFSLKSTEWIFLRLMFVLDVKRGTMNHEPQLVCRLTQQPETHSRPQTSTTSSREEIKSGKSSVTKSDEPPRETSADALRHSGPSIALALNGHRGRRENCCDKDRLPHWLVPPHWSHTVSRNHIRQENC